jgi:dephospho-CoA kinase
LAKLAGLTGGIATGKTTVGNFFREKGVYIIDADLIAREVVKKGMPAWGMIKEEFGDEILGEDGELDRKKLGSIVFSSKEKIQKLNSIVHPFVRERMMAEIERTISMEKDILLDIPLLFENGIHQWLRPVILVYAPLEVQIERLMKRDGLSREECEKRIKAQMPIEEKKKLADYIIDNSSDISKTKRQVEEVYEKIYR